MSLRKKLRYKFDNFMAKGPKALFLALFILTLLSLIAGALFILIFVSGKGYPGSWWEAIWWSLLHITDPGTFAAPGYGETSGLYKLISVLVTLFGILVFSVLIAFLNTFFQIKLENLQKGRSEIIESNFTLILGWNDKIFDVIEEIIIANENQKNTSIVILAGKDKINMDEILSKEILDKENTKIISRSGSPSNFADLNLVNFNKARSIIVLASSSAGADVEERIASDAEIIKTLLAILYHPNREKELFNVVTEIYDEKNIEVIKSFSGNNVTIVNSNEIIAKVMTQTSRQTGLPVVYEEILSFAGCEIYLNKYPKVYGKAFRNVYNKFPGGYPIGILSENDKVVINPEPDTIINNNDKLIVIAEDDDTCNFSEKLVCDYSPILGEPTGLSSSIINEKVLILGYNEKVINIVKEFEQYTSKGSEITIVYEFTNEEKNELKQRFTDITKMTVKLVNEKYNDRNVLYKLLPFTYDIIFIMSRDMNISSLEKSDADTIFTLLLLREIQKKTSSESKTRIVSEILDINNKELIETASVNDFIISYKLISMVLAQISEQRNMSMVYDELFSEDGSEIYLKPASKYFQELPKKLNFYQIMDRVYKRGEIAFGYKIYELENDIKRNHGVVLNPPKDAVIDLKLEDMIIVVAEDER